MGWKKFLLCHSILLHYVTFFLLWQSEYLKKIHLKTFSDLNPRAKNDAGRNKLFKMTGSGMRSSKTTDNKLAVESGGENTMKE